MEIQIQSSFVGRVIGRGGSKIQDLQDESGAQIKILKESESNGCTSIKLTGSSEACEKARELIEDLTSEGGRMPKGRSSYGSQNYTNESNSGNWRNDSANGEGFDRRNTSNDESFDIQIDSSYVGKVIGRGGSKIQELQEESGAQIKVSRESEGNGCTSVKLTGSAQACGKAKALIEDLTSDVGGMSMNRSNYGFNNDSSRNTSNVNSYGSSSGNWQSKTSNQDSSNRMNNEDSSVIQIDSNFVGRVIGRGGSKIRELQDESGAQIKVLKDSEAGGCTSIKLIGSVEAQEIAKTMIEELTTDGSRMSSNHY